MTIRLFNTLTKEKTPFIPMNPDHVGLYVCGPTVYNFIHLGNGRPFVVFDTLWRVLRHYYPKVTYVRNITDVDDKINAAALKNGESIADLTQRTTAAFHEDMAALGSMPPDIEPRATHHIPEMIAMIQHLIEKGHAYAAEGHVLFSVGSFSDYGHLSRRNQDEMLAGARVEVAPYKRDAGDFVLWKPSDEQTPGWESPWGYGRPGWHIECSAMSTKYLGPVFDIHAGGVDLIFPHHENEIAQSRCAHGTPVFAQYWMHNGHLTIDGTKMSKSLGNFFTVRQLLETYPGEVIRLSLLTTHYRSPLDWSEETLQQAAHSLDRLYQALRGIKIQEASEEDSQVLAALCDDLNTPQAIARLHELTTHIHKATDPVEKSRAAGLLKKSGVLMGILQQDPEAWFRQGASLSDEEIDSLLNQRREARARKDFAESDRIRDQLLSNKIVLEDSATGTTWRRDR